ncbi:MAG: DUF4175 domain-containing protein [Alphaproteobacteria bacterium]|nr:DUF4175 domain-containing protein [Alphaproteobacteria bacterium]
MSISVSIESQTGSHRRIERRIAQARAAILWERLWPRLWPANGIAGALATLALLDVFARLPSLLHALLLIAGAGAVGYFLWRRFQDFRAPGWNDGARRLERDSGLTHRPLTERNDRMVAGAGDALAENLWRAHVRARLAARNRLRWVYPHASLAAEDPHYVRYIILLLLVIGFAVAGRDAQHRLLAALTPGESAPRASLEAWIDPPAYTGEAPIYLPRGSQDRPIAVPAGSMLALRVHGGRGEPQVTFAPRAEHVPAFSGQGQDYSSNAKIARDETVRVLSGAQVLASWRLKAVPDEAPSIAFAQPPGRTERDAVKFALTAGDDYGVISARALIRPVQKSKARRTLVVDLPLSSQGKTLNDTVYRDLTAHPYAGLDVTITLEAKDAMGNIGRSRPARFTLPARVFTNPLARALIEQRQNLFLNGREGRNATAFALDALSAAPDLFYQRQTAAYVAIRAAYWALKNARAPQDIAHVEDLLWETALALERGGLSSAAEELRRLQQMISQALAHGAPQGTIDSLLQRYDQALKRYLEKLAQNPPSANSPPPKGAKVLNPQDLQALLKAIQQLAQSGARAQAQQLLAMLQGLLENLHMTAGPGGSGGEGDKAMSEALKNLGDLMGKQRQLLDKTFREQQGNLDPKAGGPKGLAQGQGSLRQQLDKLMQGIGPKAGGGAKDLGEAGKRMGEAQGKLGERALNDATEAERKALDAMRKGAGRLAEQMMKQQGDGKPGENGNDDPLGRENGGRGPGFGDQTKLPGKSQLERARTILKELRRRAEERGRPREELDYIDRLLKQF